MSTNFQGHFVLKIKYEIQISCHQAIVEIHQ